MERPGRDVAWTAEGPRSRPGPRLTHDATAVSPIIAIVLLTATVIVLAATVFVLVSDIGGDVQQEPPRLQLVSDSATKPSQWVVQIAGATRLTTLAAYQVVHTTPDQGIIVYSMADDSAFTGTGLLQVSSGDMTGKDASTRTGADGTTTKQDAQPGYRIRVHDVNDDDLYSILDTLSLTYDSDDADPTYDDPMPKGVHKIEIHHVTTGSLSGVVSNTF